MPFVHYVIHIVHPNVHVAVKTLELDICKTIMLVVHYSLPNGVRPPHMGEGPTRIKYSSGSSHVSGYTPLCTICDIQLA